MTDVMLTDVACKYFLIHLHAPEWFNMYIEIKCIQHNHTVLLYVSYEFMMLNFFTFCYA